MGMLRSGNDYEWAFESWLNDNGVNYLYVDQHKRSTLGRGKVKTFDFLLYPPGANCASGDDGGIVIAEVKGKLFKGTTLSGLRGLQCWVTMEDVRGMLKWQQRLAASGRGSRTRAVFIFAYRFTNIDVEADGMEVYDFDGNQYSFLCVELNEYIENMKLRSKSWQTVSLGSEHFRKKFFSLRQLLAPETIRPYRICY